MMSYYHPGVNEALANVKAMTTEKQLFDVLDNLYGRDNLPEDYTFDDLKFEAIAQVQRDFTDTSSREYETVQMFVAIHKASTTNDY